MSRSTAANASLDQLVLKLPAPSGAPLPGRAARRNTNNSCTTGGRDTTGGDERLTTCRAPRTPVHEGGSRVSETLERISRHLLAGTRRLRQRGAGRLVPRPRYRIHGRV